MIREIPRHEAGPKTEIQPAIERSKWSLGVGVGFFPALQPNPSNSVGSLFGGLGLAALAQPPPVGASVVIERELTEAMRLGAGLAATLQSSRTEGVSSQGRGFGATFTGRYLFGPASNRVRPSASLSVFAGSTASFAESSGSVLGSPASDVINRIYVDERFFGAELGGAVDGRLNDFLVVRLGASVGHAKFTSRDTAFQLDPEQPAFPNRTVRSSSDDIALRIQPGAELRIEF